MSSQSQCAAFAIFMSSHARNAELPLGLYASGNRSSDLPPASNDNITYPAWSDLCIIPIRRGHILRRHLRQPSRPGREPPTSRPSEYAPWGLLHRLLTRHANNFTTCSHVMPTRRSRFSALNPNGCHVAVRSHTLSSFRKSLSCLGLAAWMCPLSGCACSTIGRTTAGVRTSYALAI